jgi:amidophosphoribosyltransferase
MSDCNVRSQEVPETVFSSSNGPREACGIVGVTSESKDVAVKVYDALRALQHRGQESAGIATYSSSIHCQKGQGLVQEVFDISKISGLRGSHGIGHIRYSTAGASKLENAQPIMATSAIGDMALAHNGDIVNALEIREKLQRKGWAFISSADSEIMLRMFANEVRHANDVSRSMRNLMRTLRGSYSVCILLPDKVIAARDPFGIKPLCIGRIADDGYIVTSESVAIEMLGGELVRDVQPGEVVELSGNKMTSRRLVQKEYSAHCMFEWVYFARPDSIIDGQLVYDVRMRIGGTLARGHGAKVDLVVPVPDSGRTHAQGYTMESGVPWAEGLIKNRYVFRTFIMPDKNGRGDNVRIKLNAIRSVVDGKSIALLDDSIVRGTTMRRIVSHLRSKGAREIHLRIGCPPIIAPCYLGIDMKTRDQFIALEQQRDGSSRERTLDEIAREIGADTVEYLTVKELVECIGIRAEDICLGCVTGEYPVQITGERERSQSQLGSFDDEGPRR